MWNLEDYLKQWFQHHRHADDTRSQISAQYRHASDHNVDLWKIFLGEYPTFLLPFKHWVVVPPKQEQKSLINMSPKMPTFFDLNTCP